ncbi:MAG: hypothetical protein D6732_19680 [Methanobacteriota archaeon]|nr:MAG: hypothetical protein D6732_19680 [Euryarchaeota archaeon]
MKIWKGYGSEHSMNLVMIGYFKEARDAEKVKELFDQLVSQVMQSTNGGEIDRLPKDRFTDPMLEFLREVNLYTIGPAELEQFLYDVRIDFDGDKVVITTDEVDVSAFLKVLIDRGARVEVYSAHDYPNTGYGR